MGTRGETFALIAILALVSACSGRPVPAENRKPVHPVRGQLMVRGKPATGAFLFLVPENEPPDPTDPRPRAEVRTDGSFDLSMYDENDGAPVGDYKVLVMWQDSEGSDRLKGQYNDPAKSKLKVSIKEGKNELPPFQLN